MLGIGISANVIIPFSIRVWSKPLFTYQITSRVNSDQLIWAWWSLWRRTIPGFEIIRSRKGIRSTISSSEVDTNTAQNCNKLEINFHLPLIKSLSTKLNWSCLCNSQFKGSRNCRVLRFRTFLLYFSWSILPLQCYWNLKIAYFCVPRSKWVLRHTGISLRIDLLKCKSPIKSLEKLYSKA